jgi:hypothetical protein
MIDLLAIAPPFAAEILERTSSTVRVQGIVQISMAPAFLLAGIGAIMNVLVNRMIWIANRVERIDARIEDGRSDPEQAESIAVERAWLENRRHLAQVAVMCGTASAAIISLVIALLFISAWITTQIGLFLPRDSAGDDRRHAAAHSRPTLPADPSQIEIEAGLIPAAYWQRLTPGRCETGGS